MQKGKVVAEEAFWERREVKDKREKKDIAIWMQSSKEYQKETRKPS